MLKELIDKFYLDREKDKNRDQTQFYITDAGRCQRSIFFKFKKAPREEMEARVLRMFEHGDYIHELIRDTLYSLGIIRNSEIKIPPQNIISGRADAIISLDGQEYVLDIKSMNSLIFKNLTQPKEENVNQIQLYLHFFKKEKGILLYVNKDTQELKEFLVYYNPVLVQNLLKDLNNLKTKINSNIIPQRLLDYSENWQCRYCQFRELCQMAGYDELNWEKFKNKMESLS